MLTTFPSGLSVDIIYCRKRYTFMQPKIITSAKALKLPEAVFDFVSTEVAESIPGKRWSAGAGFQNR